MAKAVVCAVRRWRIYIFGGRSRKLPLHFIIIIFLVVVVLAQQKAKESQKLRSAKGYIFDCGSVGRHDMHGSCMHDACCSFEWYPNHHCQFRRRHIRG